ncbi:hypothetical protein [Parafrankia sp. FMc2]|uniref:hypothetical protein n=1 Tax=Parafrankia sp. FMc2 TaxID=3233196 RepID=UPI0034D7564A
MGVLLTAGLVCLLIGQCGNDSAPAAAPDPPGLTLENGWLEGPRKLSGVACLGLVADVSSSMGSWTAARSNALAQLETFAHANLKADDLLAAIVFSDSAVVTLQPTRIHDLPGRMLPETIGGGGTLFAPVVDKVTETFAGRGCAATAVAVISDGGVGDDPSTLAGRIENARFDELAFLVPDSTGNGSAQIPVALAQPDLARTISVRFFGDDSTLGASYGELLAGLTGRRFTLR